MLAATVLLGPAILFAAFFLLVQTVAGGQLFSALGWLVAALPADPVLGAVLLIMGLLGSVAVLLLACILMPRLYPALLLVVGSLATTYVFALAGPDGGTLWVPAFGVGGLFLAALQIRRARCG